MAGQASQAQKEKIYTVQTVHHRNTNLCGREFFFRKKRINDPQGGEIWVGNEYNISSKIFNSVKVLEEYIKKLTNPLNPTVRIINVQEK